MTGLRAPRSEAQPFARVAVLTSNGRGAIAVVRVWGIGALAVVDSAFRPARGPRLSETRPGRPRLGRIGAGEGDEVVALVISGDRLEVEIHGHAGPAAVALVLDALTSAGAEKRQPVAWVRHGASSLVTAEAWVDLRRAPTLRTAEILLDQAEGALGRELARLGSIILTEPENALAGLDRLLQWSSVGLRLTRGWSVVLAGRANVGKSALLNALAGYERAIVAPTPGTTRDVITLRTALDGWPVELCDTAGLREADDSIENEGINLGRGRRAESDLTVVVLDQSEPLTDTDHNLIQECPAALLVASKSDLTPSWSPSEVALQVAFVSSVSGEGIDGLAKAIARRIVPDQPPPGSGMPFRPVHDRRIREARGALDAGRPELALGCLEALLGSGDKEDATRRDG